MPERFFPEVGFVHKYMSSDIIKGAVVAVTIVVVNLLLRDTMVLAQTERAKYLDHHSHKVASPPSPVQIAAPSFAAAVAAPVLI